MVQTCMVLRYTYVCMYIYIYISVYIYICPIHGIHTFLLYIYGVQICIYIYMSVLLMHTNTVMYDYFPDKGVYRRVIAVT